MTKADLVDQVTAIGDLTRRDGEVIVDTLFDAVIGALKSGDKIEIRGFGSFRTRQRNARTGRNPKTGAKVDVPAKRVPFFKPSKELRDSVNPNGAGKATGSAPKIFTTTCCSTSPTAIVVIRGVTWLPRFRTGRNATRSTRTPSAAAASMAPARTIHGGKPASASTRPAYAPTMKTSP